MRLAFLDAFQFGIPEIDQGHERMILMLNEIVDCMEAKDFDVALRQVIHLIAVERKHAATETKLLTQNGYHAIQKHSLHHENIRDQLSALMVSLGDQNFEQATIDFSTLRRNFLDDITLGDLPFKSLLQDRILGW